MAVSYKCMQRVRRDIVFGVHTTDNEKVRGESWFSYKSKIVQITNSICTV